ncbi:ATP-dependent RNA helicase DbpA [Metallibacterium sp.]|uniref:ATP-dependent RNA helicase DbpA n=1 Tax=Metallibacterium sp. TaxID=2940281 RepID=UPI00260A480E|nr:ATP-dependent RNA helicase DbpA [Metallibacterium sp.]
MTDFVTLLLSPALLQSLAAMGYAQMTPVQAASLPPILAGQDVIAQARTGSGKTAAFALGLLARLDVAQNRVQGLVLCPTRELADQVSKEIRRLASAMPNIKVLTLSGGIALGPQLASLAAHDPHLVVGTPGRVQELLRKRSLHLSSLRMLVLDEADRMLDMGFSEAITEIIGKTPPQRQTLLFSATWPQAIRAISAGIQRDPVSVTVDGAAAQIDIEQRFFEVEPTQKMDALAQLLRSDQPESALVFCNTRRDTREVAEELDRRGFSALALHGEMEQRDRDEVLVRFANRSCAVLVATDVAARGLDVHELAAVISWELPSDPDVHVHRIGRTGRAGAKGLALSLCTPRERARACAIEARQGAPLAWHTLKPAGGAGKRLVLAPMATVCIDGGRKDKMRPGDILGALTGAAGLAADDVGKIDVFATRAYVAIRRNCADKAVERLRAGTIKGRRYRVRRIGG